MKNVTSLFEFVYLVMLMAAGVVGVVLLLDANTFYRYDRFLDKSQLQTSLVLRETVVL